MTCNIFIINEEIIFDVDACELKPLNEIGEAISLNVPTARCLQLLLESNGAVVSRDDFLEQVWMSRGIVVSQNTFYQNISLLRKSLMKAGLSKDIITTVRRKGFVLSPGVSYDCAYKNDIESGVAATDGESRVVHKTRSIQSEEMKVADSVQESSRGTVLKLPRWLSIALIIFLIAEFCSLFFRHFGSLASK